MTININSVFITLFSLFVCNCAQIQVRTDPTYSKAIENSMPRHNGSYDTASYEFYNAKVYTNSVEMTATSGVVRLYLINAFDLDRNGILDSVFVKTEGVWKFGSTLTTQNLIPSSVSQTTLRDSLALANTVRVISDQNRKARLVEKSIEEKVAQRVRRIREAESLQYGEYYQP